MSVNQKLGSLLFILLACCAGSAFCSPAYPLKVSVNGRYLVDQNGVPFLMIGDSPHNLATLYSTSDAYTYLQNRATNGIINTLWVECLPVNGSADDSNFNGDKPFTGKIGGAGYDMTTTNLVYWSHVRDIVRMAGTNGIQVLLDTFETSQHTGMALTNGAVRCRTYGQFLGNYFKDVANIIWITGNDFQTWRTATNDSVISAIALGIQDTDTNHLQTVQLDYNVSMSYDDPNWRNIITMNGVYTYYVTYDETSLAYRTDSMPVFLEESAYEGDFFVGAGGTLNNLRRQEYWSLLAGALAGHMYGNHYIYNPEPGWQTNLNTPGTAQLGMFKSFFTNCAWYNLVPDTSHTVVTAGYGTYSSGTTFNENSDYVTTARAPDGTLVVAYTPTNHTLTLDMTKLSGMATARWFDPVNGAYSTISGSPFTNSGTHNFTPTGNNSAGDGDWVLVLEAQPINMVVPQITAWMFEGGNFVVEFSTVLGQSYELQRADLLGSAWLPVATNIPGTGGTVQVGDTNAVSQLQRFYRVKTGM